MRAGTGLDTLRATTHLFRRGILAWSRRDEEAVAAYRKALEISPGITTAHAGIGNFYLSLGRAKAAVAEAGKESSAGDGNGAHAMAHHALGDRTSSNQALAALIAEVEEWAFQIACVYGFRGEADKAFEWLERVGLKG